MENTAYIYFKNVHSSKYIELEIPLDITANDLIVSLNEIYELGIDVEDIINYYLISENPIALIRGNKTLEQFGVRNGTTILFKKGEL